MNCHFITKPEFCKENIFFPKMTAHTVRSMLAHPKANQPTGLMEGYFKYQAPDLLERVVSLNGFLFCEIKMTQEDLSIQ